MRHYSKKRQAQNTAAREIRQAILAERELLGCSYCGHGPRKPHRYMPRELSELCITEIHSGRGNRLKCLDKPFGLLAVCVFCNQKFTDRARFPEARQLAILMEVAPHRYDLFAYNELVGYGQQRILQEEVDAWSQLTRP